MTNYRIIVDRVHDLHRQIADLRREVLDDDAPVHATAHAQLAHDLLCAKVALDAAVANLQMAEIEAGDVARAEERGAPALERRSRWSCRGWRGFKDD
jgi:hypothetical protein